VKIQPVCSYLRKFVSIAGVVTVAAATTYAGETEPPARAESGSDGVSSPSFSAEYRYSHQASETLLDSARVVVSEVGLRIDQLMDHSGNGLIANFESNQLWFLNATRELVHKVPVIALGPLDQGTLDSREPTDNQEPEQFGGLLPGFIQFAPCPGMRSEFIENVALHGHSLERWQCFLDQSNPALEQLFSPRLGVVLWSRDTDGFISELTDVRLQEPNPGVFKPPSHYRAVDLRELIQGTSAIEVYAEPD